MPTIAKSLSQTLGENIQFFRKKAKLTQQSLALLIGYEGPEAGSVISRIESGDRQPRLATVRKIAEALGVKVVKLIS